MQIQCKSCIVESTCQFINRLTCLNKAIFLSAYSSVSNYKCNDKRCKIVGNCTINKFLCPNFKILFYQYYESIDNKG